MVGFDRLAAVVTDHPWVVAVLVLVVTAVAGVGLTAMEESTSVSGLSGDSAVATASDQVQQQFSTGEPNTTTTLVAVQRPDGNALSKASLLRSLRYQRALRTNETVNATLADSRPTFGFANLVVRASMAQQGQTTAGSGARAGGGTDRDTREPTIDAQIETLAAMDRAAVAATVERLLDPDTASPLGRTARRFVGQSAEPGSATATARLLVVRQSIDGDVRMAAALPERVVAGQTDVRTIATAQPGPETYRVFSRGLVSTQQSAAISDSLAVLGPLALLFVLGSLSLAYRDPVDVLLGLVGVGTVLVWTLGAAGWLGIPFNQTMIAVPILLIGLSVDYALHVVMRYRERRTDNSEEVRPAMRRSLVGVGPALVLVTATTAVGFLATLTSPLGDIQSFGVVTAIGIVATLFVFGLFVPALKSIVATRLARRGWDRTPAPPGSSGRLQRVLVAGAIAARRAPFVVLAIALLVSAGGAYSATQVDVSASPDLFMADDPPEWTDRLPEPVRPGEFYLKENRRAIYASFQSPDTQGYVLVEGNVTAPGTLDRIAATQRRLSDADAVFTGPGGEPAVVTPVSAMRRVATRNRSFNATFTAADTDGDGVPDRQIERVYDAFVATAPGLAAQTVHRTSDGEYTALRVRAAFDGNAPRDAAVSPLVDAAERIDSREGTTAIATGRQVIERRINDRLTTTLVESLTVTLGVVLALLALVFRRREGSASLAVVTLVPVTFAVTWLLGTMAILDISISVITALVGSIAVGLGVDYAIHVTERFTQERTAGAGIHEALVRTATGTGGALVSSALTTATGFGVLTASLLPGLRQFGFVLAVGIIYAFLASVFVQPSLLTVWTRYGPGSTATVDRSVAISDD